MKNQVLAIAAVALLLAGGVAFYLKRSAPAVVIVEQPAPAAKEAAPPAAPEKEPLRFAGYALPTEGPFAPPTEEQAAAAAEPVAAEELADAAPAEPTATWRIEVNADLRDLNNNALVKGQLEALFLDEEGETIGRLQMSPGALAAIDLPAWPARVAVGGRSDDAMVARGFWRLPSEPGLGGMYRSSGSADFTEPDFRAAEMGRMAQQSGRAPGWMNRMNFETETNVAFSFDAREYPAARGELATLEPDASAGPDGRTLHLDVTLRASYFGRLEVTVKNLVTSDFVTPEFVAGAIPADAPDRLAALVNSTEALGSDKTTRYVLLKELSAAGLLEGPENESLRAMAGEATGVANRATGKGEAIDSVNLDRPWGRRERQWGGGGGGAGGGGGRDNRGAAANVRERGGERGGERRGPGAGGPGGGPEGRPGGRQGRGPGGGGGGERGAPADAPAQEPAAESSVGTAVEPVAEPAAESAVEPTPESPAEAPEESEAELAAPAPAPAAPAVYVRPEIRAGGEPPSYRFAQRSLLMETQPKIEGNKIVFAPVPPGEYRVEIVTSLGRSAQSEVVVVKELETAKTEIDLKPGTGLVVLAYKKEKNGTRKPIEGATVRLTSRGGWGGGGGGGRSRTGIAYDTTSGTVGASQQNPSETTDSNGEARIDGLDAGQFELVVTHKDFARATKRVSLKSSAETREEIELYDEKAVVEFHVVSTDGLEVPEGRVIASRRQRGGWGGRGGGAQRGDLEAEVKFGRAEMELDYGQWIFAASSPGFQDTSMPGMEIADPGPHEITLNLPPKLPVTIKLTRAGAPAAATPVTLFSRSESNFGPNAQTTDEAGMALFESAPGEFAVYASERYLDSITVRIDSDNVFTLNQDGLSVEGYVRDAADNAPIRRAQVRLVMEMSADDPGFTIPSVFRDPRGRTNDEGLYRMNEVAEGTYHLEITADGFASLVTDPFPVNAETARAPMTHMLEAVKGKIVGSVRRPDGSPVRGVFVRTLVNERGVPYPVNFRDVVSNEEGHYEIGGLEPGLYVAQFSSLIWTGMNYLPHESPVLEVAAGSEVPYDFVMEPGGSVRISVRDAQQVAVGGARIQLVEMSGNAVGRPYVDSPEPISDTVGEFHWTEVAPGTYTVRVNKAGWAEVLPAPTVTVEADNTVRVTATMARN